MKFFYNDLKNNRLPLSNTIINFIDIQRKKGVILIPAKCGEYYTDYRDIYNINFKNNDIIQCSFNFDNRNNDEWIYYNKLK